MASSSGPSGIDSVACSATIGVTANSAAAMSEARSPSNGRNSHHMLNTTRMPPSSDGSR
jgi:hypothetical protein